MFARLDTEASRFNVFVEHAEDCMDLLPALADRVSHRICEFGGTAEQSPGLQVFGVVCTGQADMVISAVGDIARAMIRVTQR